MSQETPTALCAIGSLTLSEAQEELDNETSLLSKQVIESIKIHPHATPGDTDGMIRAKALYRHIGKLEK